MSAGVRCFLALLPTATSLAALERCQQALRNARVTGGDDVRWLAPETLHLTVRFLGDSSARQIGLLADALPALARPLPALACAAMLAWPAGAPARVLVLELAPNARLTSLADACEVQARAAGFSAEPQTFRPHVTLARLHGSGPALPAAPPKTLRFDRLALMQSTRGPAGAAYAALAAVALA